MKFVILFILGSLSGIMLFPVGLMMIWIFSEIKDISRLVHFVLFILFFILGAIFLSVEPARDWISLIVTYVCSLIVPTILYKLLLPSFKK